MEISTIYGLLSALVLALFFYILKLRAQRANVLEQLVDANGKTEAYSLELTEVIGKYADCASRLEDVVCKNNAYATRFDNIINVETAMRAILDDHAALENTVSDLRQAYKEKKEIFDALVLEAAIYDETIELSELGFYKAHYDFDTSEQYKIAAEGVRLAQKEMINSKTAIYCETKWTVNNSQAKGQTMTNRGVRLTARAFNNECDAAISSVRWNNATRTEERIIKAFIAINKLNETQAIEISPMYLELKIQEFRLAHEYKEKRNKEREEQAAIRQLMREEEKLREDSEIAFEEEARYQKMLDKAYAEAERATGEKLSELQRKIASLAADLAVARDKSERALSMAQQTKAGHVYIISNIGSFGEDVYKIGMIRRLDPIDRVKELSSASVPFTFDVHAMIYSKDAPALENKLHRIFDSHRLNLVNTRKEFFRASINDIEQAVKVNFVDAEFYLTAEARDHKESLAILAQRSEQKTRTDARNQFPAEI